MAVCGRHKGIRTPQNEQHRLEGICLVYSKGRCLKVLIARVEEER